MLMHAYLHKTCCGKASWDTTSKLSAYVEGLDKKAKDRYIEKISGIQTFFKPIPRPIQGEHFEGVLPMEDCNPCHISLYKWHNLKPGKV